MTDYGERTGTGGAGTGVITNDDEYLLDIPDEVEDWKFDPAEIKDDRSY